MTYFNPPEAYLANIDINTTYYTPQEFTISAIAFGKTTTITTTEDLDYVVGQQVRLHIPSFYGTRQLNNKSAYVISLPSSTQIEIDVDTSIGYTPFVASPTYGPTLPNVTAIGSIRTGQPAVTSRTNVPINVPGSFRNISS